VAELGPLSTLEHLQRLYAPGNAIVDLGPLTGLTDLEELYVGNNPIEDLSPLAGLPALLHLEAPGTLIEDITPLASFSQLGFVNLRNNQIVDMSPLVGKTWALPLGCADLWVFGNPLSEDSKLIYNEQICGESGVYLDYYCDLCEQSCIDLCPPPCTPDTPGYPKC
jgi:internalin A